MEDFNVADLRTVENLVELMQTQAEKEQHEQIREQQRRKKKNQARRKHVAN